MKLRNTLLSAAAVIALGTAGSAATVVNGGALNAGDTGLATGLTNPGDLISFTSVSYTHLTLPTTPYV